MLLSYTFYAASFMPQWRATDSINVGLICFMFPLYLFTYFESFLSQNNSKRKAVWTIAELMLSYFLCWIFVCMCVCVFFLCSTFQPDSKCVTTPLRQLFRCFEIACLQLIRTDLSYVLYKIIAVRMFCLSPFLVSPFKNVVIKPKNQTNALINQLPYYMRNQQRLNVYAHLLYFAIWIVGIVPLSQKPCCTFI